MARVVQRRKSPPYALIIFVFLFLISTTLFVLQYMEVDELKKRTAQQATTLSKLASTEEIDRAPVRELMKVYDEKKRSGAVAPTAVAQLSETISNLTQVITGTGTEPQDALKKADDLYQEIKSRRGLIQEVREANKKLANALEQAKDLESQRKEITVERDNALETNKALQADFESKATKLNQQIAGLKSQGQDREKAHQEQMDTAKKEWGDARADLNKKIAGLVKDVEEQKREVKKWIAMYKALEEKFNDVRPKETPNLARKPDGKIMKLVEEANLCYIDLGLKDRIIPGLTFTVYSQAGIPEDGEGKAKLIVTNVGESVSECRITVQNRQNPILLNDLIANLVFDPVRKYVFVVEGEFDLHGTGQPTRDGAKEVRQMISRFGGVVGKGVEVDTDFVVMGEPPLRPAKPKEDAPPQVWEAYRLQVEIFDRYHAVRQLAQSLRIPILNTNRFIALMGYAPLEEVK